MGLPLAGSAADAAIDAALGDVRLRLIGPESCVDATAAYAEVVDQLIGQMEHVRRSHGVVLDCLGLTASEDFGAQAVLSEVATTIDYALDDACARFHFPRPLVVFSPRWDHVDCAVD
jgi:diaminopimelate decarboxylase